jgi:hypothetical protein
MFAKYFRACMAPSNVLPMRAGALLAAIDLIRIRARCVISITAEQEDE